VVVLPGAIGAADAAELERFGKQLDERGPTTSCRTSRAAAPATKNTPPLMTSANTIISAICRPGAGMHDVLNGLLS
jgi:hypothetical protein